jgi:cytochrome c peroxidase
MTGRGWRRVAVGVAVLAGCDGDVEASAWPFPLPAGFPAPPVPEDNPITAGKVELGRHLFYDRRLSGNEQQSCGDCHHQDRAFSDGLALPVGSTGDVIPRNAMTLTNAGYWSTFTWMNPALVTLEEQALVPMFADHPVELGMAPVIDEILARFAGDRSYLRMFAAAFPGELQPVSTENIVRAIASFERTIISGSSAYDRYWYGGDDAALTDQQVEGMDLFFSERFECYHCHAGAMFTTAFVTEGQLGAEPSFINNGVYNVGGSGAYPEPNTGLFAFTGETVDMGRIRVPTLRNIAVTAPYFHDGSAATLEDVLAHYVRGGRNVEEGANAGDGAINPFKHPLVRAFEATPEEVAAVIAFLESLTDEDLLVDPALASPFPSDPR